MIDYDHSHPSVILWPVANESYFNLESSIPPKRATVGSNRPTTFENPDQNGTPFGGVTDIANNHYTPWPYDLGYESDPRPVLMGENYFEITHEQTDVAVDPGLRELWGFGHAEPDSAFGVALTRDYDRPGGEQPEPLLRPGGWSFMVIPITCLAARYAVPSTRHFTFPRPSTRAMPGITVTGASSNAWRRPKPEWFLCRHVFSPVWLETRHLEFAPGVKSIHVPVAENRFAFTDFSDLKFSWQINDPKANFIRVWPPAPEATWKFPSRTERPKAAPFCCASPNRRAYD